MANLISELLAYCAGMDCPKPRQCGKCPLHAINLGSVEEWVAANAPTPQMLRMYLCGQIPECSGNCDTCPLKGSG